MGAIGAVMGIGGAALSAGEAGKKRGQLKEAQGMWLPNIDQYTNDYFAQLMQRTPDAKKVADATYDADLSRQLAGREKALPGTQDALTGAMGALAPLLRGELPPSVMQAFQRAGGASTAGLGFGGSGFGFLNTGLFGARGSLGAMQTGFGLLPALMSTLPQVNSPGTAAFLQSIMTPAQRTQTQLQIRGQNLGIESQLAGMPTSKEVWGQSLQEAGGALAGGAMTAGMGGGFGGMGGGGGGNTIPSGPSWQGQNPYMQFYY
jgi:hypothetical protein